MLCFTSYLVIPYDVMRTYTAKHHLIVIILICTILLNLLLNTCLFIVGNAKCLLSTLWIIDFIIRITQLCYLLHYLTSCSIDWCGEFVTNLVVFIQITQLFILEFHLNLKEPMPKAYLILISYCSKSVTAESKYQFYSYYHKFTDFCNLNNWNLWFIGLPHLFQHR